MSEVAVNLGANRLPRRDSRVKLRFSLSALMLLIAVLAIPLAWLSHGARRQRQAVEQISRFGYVVYDHEYSVSNAGKNANVNFAPAPGPRWLRRWIGDDYFRTVRAVHFSATDESMKALPQLSHVQWIHLEGPQVTDDGFRRMAGMHQLDRLQINDGHTLRNEHMVHLTDLPRLRFLVVCDTPIDDEAVRYFEQMKSLETLLLCDTRMTDAGAQRLRESLPQAVVEVGGKYTPPAPDAVWKLNLSTNDEVTRKHRRARRESIATPPSPLPQIQSTSSQSSPAGGDPVFVDGR